MAQQGEFGAATLSSAARRAAYSRGIRNASTWNALANVKVLSEYDEENSWDVAVAEVFGVHGSKVTITAGDIFVYAGVLDYLPMARV